MVDTYVYDVNDNSKQLQDEDMERRKYYGETTFTEKFNAIRNHVVKETPYYFKSFLPILNWLPKYNRRWLVGDMIAGITVGAMVVPQSLAYAKLANLPVVYGLYTGFMGVMLYCLMGTSREISVGPTAVLSLLVGSVVTKVLARTQEFSPEDIAIALCFVGSLVTLFLGIFRLGILLDLIPNPVIIGFTTGSAFTIMLTQAAPLLGVPNVSSNDPTITIIYNFFTNLPNLNWRDLVFGLSSLLFILTIDGSFKLFKKPYLRYLKIASNGLAVILFTLIAYLVISADPKFSLKIVKDVPKGFKYIGPPNLSVALIKEISLELIPVILIGVLEHVALCKAFARQSGYQISSSQELFALGICNFAASFFAAFPATGSFSRSAVKSQSGVKTPFAGVWTGVVVLMALGFLTPAFYYIPSATLSAIIICSASSLVSSYKTVFDLWKVQPLDCIVFLVSTLTTFFAGAEMGIAASVGLSFVILIYQIARPRLFMLAQVIDRPYLFIDNSHPSYTTTTPVPGVLVFKPQESLIFPNIDYLRDKIIDSVLEFTRTGMSPANSQDKLWSDDLEARGDKLRIYRAKLNNTKVVQVDSLPKLKAIVFDFSSVNLIDSSGLQGLFDVRDMLTQFSGNGKQPLPSSDVKLDEIGFTNVQYNANPDIPSDNGTSQLPNSDTVFDANTDPRFTNLHYNTTDPNISASSSTTEIDTPFEIHFVSTHPQVLKVLELSGITAPISPILDNGNKDREAYTLEEGANLPDRLKHVNYVEPIVSNASRYVHLTVTDAIDRIKIHLR